jgi:hypothetical protein
MLLAYPSEKDAFAALAVASGPLMTGSVDSHAEAHALWVLAGYGLGRSLPDTSAQAAAAAGPVIQILQSIPWRTLLPIIENLLLQWLQKATQPQAPAPAPAPSPVPVPPVKPWG